MIEPDDGKGIENAQQKHGHDMIHDKSIYPGLGIGL